MKAISIKIFTLAFLISFFYSCTKEDVGTEILKYKVGDEGPAGGIVFYVNTNTSDEWKYIEIAPEDIDGNEWGCFNSPIVDARKSEIGMGKENTIAIVNFHNNFNEYYTNPVVCSDISNGTVAAKTSLEYVFGGHDDWFLPSKDEMKLIYEKLHLQGLGNFDTDNTLYWSSTEYDDNTVVTTDFSNGDQGFLPKQTSFGLTKIRVIRYF